MVEYQPFSISNFRTGFAEMVEPWLLPRDAFQVMVNAHLYRGVLEKISGYTTFARFSKRYIRSDGLAPDGTDTYDTVLNFTPVTDNIVIIGTIVPGVSVETMTYTGDDLVIPNQLNFTGDNGGTATVNIATKAIHIEFGANVPIDTYSFIQVYYDAADPTPTAIMGIKPYFGHNGTQEVLVFNQVAVGKIIPINSAYVQVAQQINNAITEIYHDYYIDTIFSGNGATTTFTGGSGGVKTFPTQIIPNSIVITQYDSSDVAIGTITDNGAGGFVSTDYTLTNAFVNYRTGAYTLTFGSAPANNTYFSVSLGQNNESGAVFHGTISDFFSLTNYQFNAFFVNNVDPICYYNDLGDPLYPIIRYLNTNLSVKKVLATSGVPNYDISTCLHVFTLRERLLAISPVVQGTRQQSSVWWSTALDPFLWTNDEFEQADTSQPIKAIGYINTDLVIRFSNSESVFRWTNDENSPFRFDNTNNMWACDAPYSAISYDKWFSSVGKPAIVGSDAVNVRRVDEIIPDFTDPYALVNQTPIPYMSQTSIQQCYGERFDDIKEGWLCYNSSPASEQTVTASDSILAFNYLDNTYAIYEFPFSCLGLGRISKVPVWGNTFIKWGDNNDTWGNYKNSALNSLIDLAGDQFNNVFLLNDGNTKGDGLEPILMNVITKNFNPFIEAGELCRFGYMDIFVTANATATLRVQFFLNDELYVDGNGEYQGYYQESVIQFNPKDAMSPVNNQVKVWKRIYVGAVGKEHTIRFFQKQDDFSVTAIDQPIYIHAFILYMKPAGRIFN